MNVDRKTAPYYVLPRKYGSSFVKEGDYFRSQGGLYQAWGEFWIPVEASSLEHARRLADKMITKSTYRIWNSEAPGL